MKSYTRGGENANTGQPSDEALIHEAVSGDVDAFGTLYERYLPQIYRYLYSRTWDVRRAEDDTETVFLKVWEALPRFRPEAGSFRTWLFRIAHNQLVDSYRAHRAEEPLPEEPEWPDETTLPEDHLVAGEAREKVALALGQLRPEYRTVLELRFFHGLSHAEAAGILGKSESAVRIQQFRALQALWKVLNRE